MTNFKMLFLYLKKQNVFISEKEFAIQYESHPEYPSLLAVSDTLNFFNVSNGALHVTSDEIDLLPTIFITKLEDADENSLAVVETQTSNQSYTIYTNSRKNSVSRDSLLAKWKGMVFLVEDTLEKQPSPQKFTFHHLISICCLISFLFLLKQYVSNIQQLFFIIFPILGSVLSIFALKKLFNINSSLVNAFCGTTETRNCTEVVDSSAWKLFEKISFSDLSIVFFSFQIVLFCLAAITNTIHFFLQTQLIALIVAIPIVLLSLYYQKFIIKKWCPICISIIGIFLLEFVYLINFSGIHFSWETNFLQYNLYVFTFLFLLISWHYLKDKLITINNLQKEVIQANRFKRNYQVFKNTLISNPKFALPQTSFVFSKGTKLTIDFITSPYCGFCKAPTEMLRNFLKKYGAHISIRFMYNLNLETRNDNSKQFLRNLVYIQQKLGNEAFFNALDYWYEVHNHEKWLKKYQQEFDYEMITKMLQTQRSWCIANEFTFTPCVFVNGYAYPKMYSISDITYFIEELIDDKIIKLAEAEKLSTE